MHHSTKKSLVNQYAQMKADGSTEDQLREALKNEEKVEGQEDIDMIMEALTEQEADMSKEEAEEIVRQHSGINGSSVPEKLRLAREVLSK